MATGSDLTNELVILYALELLGGAERPVHMDDIGVQCFKLAPNRFAMKKYPEYPDMESVSKRFRDRKSFMRRGELVTGSLKRGWMLTPRGTAALESSRSALPGVETRRTSRREPVERRHLHLRVGKITGHTAYKRFVAKEEPADYELLESLGCNVNTARSVVAEQLNIVRALADRVNGRELLDYVDYCQRRLLEGG